MTQKHILIVDDDVTILEILKYTVEQLCPQCHVWTAGDGYSALKLINTRNLTEPFDLILVDYNMPKMNGVYFARAVRSIWPDVNITLMSGSPHENRLVALAKHHNLNGYLKKPLAISRLQHLLNNT